MSREALIDVLIDTAPDYWVPEMFTYLADALTESDDSDDIAYILWTYGMHADHEGCLYADGDNDADYENRCAPCVAYLAHVAAQVEEALR